MVRPFLLAVVAAASLSSSACSRDADRAAPAASSPGASVAHTAASVVPGSHEDWCDEHGVPESQCSRCNPKLIPAFKATGDWCDEHGLPESQCLRCHPDLKIVRPSKS